ncbi:phospholipase ABHD3-like isoform X2 [Siniperca chuatsi]|uniref:phospholipase ABHD3-like isoform X2 n=1 Tax=Siniperca chuatsi TaxID=119488 RepID=UPI001CE1463B|nr:phospholipase ABHD3-like isoform X2 [Siniperca chuatsi]
MAMFSSYLELWRTYWECVSRPYTVFICSLAAALYYLWARKCQTPTLVSSAAFSAFLHKHCPVVAERFSPTPWCWGGRLQTLVCALLKSRPPVTYRNELIRTVDGGQISLDWVDNEASGTYPESSTRPTVLILPGLTGNSQQSYVLHAIGQATRRGYRCVVFNNRGNGQEELLTPVTYCAANTSDLERVVQHVKGLYPHAPVLGAGVSLGGHRKVLEKVVDVDYVLKARSIREFDERITSVLFGYKSCMDYYRDASPDKKLPNTAVPILCLNAADDPFSPQHAFPVTIVESLPNVALLLTAHGGHIAFLQGLFPLRRESYMDRLFGQFVQAAFEHPRDIKKACGIKEEKMS